MGAQAARVYITRHDTERLKSLIAALPAHARVRLTLKDGSTCTGVVATRPNVQAFRDVHGVEGTNAVLSLERHDVPHGKQCLWLDQIAHIEHLDSGLAGEN